MAVYFLQEATKSPDAVKIGSGTKPLSRKKTLETGNPRRLKLLAVMSGSSKEEKNLHKKFKKFNIHGEWFEYRDELKEFIINLRLSTTLEDELELIFPRHSSKGSIETKSKSHNIEEQRTVVLNAVKKFPNNREKQIKHSGLKKSTFYTRKKELVEMGLVDDKPLYPQKKDN